MSSSNTLPDNVRPQIDRAQRRGLAFGVVGLDRHRGAGLWTEGLDAVLPFLPVRVRLLDGVRDGLPGHPAASSHDRRMVGPSHSPHSGGGHADDSGDDRPFHPGAVRHVEALSVDAARFAGRRSRGPFPTRLSRAALFHRARGCLLRDLESAGCLAEQVVGRAGPHRRSGPEGADDESGRAGNGALGASWSWAMVDWVMSLEPHLVFVDLRNDLHGDRVPRGAFVFAL